jgi:hypothetical protein
MELTKEQIESAQKGEVVRVQTDSGEIVVVKAEVYDKLVGLVYDELDPRDTYPAVLKAWDAEGSPDDATAYQDLS